MSGSDKAKGGSDKHEGSKHPIRDGIDEARTKAHDLADRAKDIAGDTFSGGLEGSPLLALAGGIAVGAIIGAILPRTEREGAVLGAVGARLIDAAREAVEAARDTGRDKLDEAGLSRDGARDAVRGILDAALSAAFSAGNAAAEAAKHKVTEGNH